MNTKGKVDVAKGNGWRSSDAGLKRMALCCEGCDPIAFVGHPRGYHGPLHVCHDIAAARLVVEANDPGATVTLNGRPVPAGSIPLACGRNVFRGTITAADGQTQSTFNGKVFRAYPHLAWTKVTEKAPWAPRDSAGELVFRGRMWLLGGYIPQTSNDVWSSTDGVDWRREGDVPSRRGIDIPVAFVLGDRMWVVDIDGALFSSADGQAWSEVMAMVPWGNRHCAGCAVFNDRVWVMGGSRDGETLNDVWSSTDGIHWKLEVEQAPWCKRQITHTPVVLNGRLWLLGGGALGSDYYPSVVWNDVWSTADGIHWEQVLDHAPWVARIWGSTAVYQGRMWLIAGFRSEPAWENLGDVWYSTDGRDWRQLETVPTLRHSGTGKGTVRLLKSIWEPRHEQSVYAFGEALWVVAGMIWPLMNDVWRLTIPGLSFVTQPVVETYTGTRYEYQARADFNHSRQPLRYQLERGPAWLSVEADTGRLSGVAPQPGDVEIRLEACDATGATTRQDYTLHVLPFG